MNNYSNAYIINSNYKKRKKKRKKKRPHLDSIRYSKQKQLDNVVLSKNQCLDLNKLMSKSN